MTKLTICVGNLVSLDGKCVGRIDRDSFQMPSGARRGGVTTFFTGPFGSYDQPHTIEAPVYVPRHSGSVSNWTINPAFEAAVREAMRSDA